IKIIKCFMVIDLSEHAESYRNLWLFWGPGGFYSLIRKFCIFSSMKWIPVFLLCLLAGLPNDAKGQHLPDFNEAVDPTDLEPAAVFFHLDTVRQYRKPVKLDFVRQEFAPDTPVELETFYQKSAHHTLLRLGKISFSPVNLFAMTEGSGHTFFRM